MSQSPDSDPSGSGDGSPGQGPIEADQRRLLAIDAGLRAGIAVYRGDGRLESYRSTNFGSIRRLKSGVYGVARGVEALAEIVVEGGGGGYAEPWIKEAQRRGIPGRVVDARVWRARLLLPRDRRRGVDAKGQADTVARRIIEWAGAPRPTTLRHDAAEAILVGLWAVLEAGWLTAVPEAVREG